MQRRYKHNNPAFFSEPSLNRTADERLRGGALQQTLSEARYLVVSNGDVAVTRDGRGAYNPVYLPHSEVEPSLRTQQDGSSDRGLTWLGADGNGQHCFSIETGPSSPDLPRDAQFKPPKSIAAAISTRLDAALMAQAAGKSRWHNNTAFCSKCGSPTRASNMGAARECVSSACGAVVFPRNDPAVIVLVTHGEYALLGRQSAWVPGRFSCLAGFVEMGETLEDSVIREVFEESGVRVNRDTISYIASQPWPFPQSLMLGFHAEAESVSGGLPEVNIDANEIEHAMWVSRAELRDIVTLRGQDGSALAQLDAMAYENEGKARAERASKDANALGTDPNQIITVPGPYALAWQLINSWLDADPTNTSTC